MKWVYAAQSIVRSAVDKVARYLFKFHAESYTNLKLPLPTSSSQRPRLGGYSWPHEHLAGNTDTLVINEQLCPFGRGLRLTSMYCLWLAQEAGNRVESDGSCCSDKIGRGLRLLKYRPQQEAGNRIESDGSCCSDKIGRGLRLLKYRLQEEAGNARTRTWTCVWACLNKRGKTETAEGHTPPPLLTSPFPPLPPPFPPLPPPPNHHFTHTD